MRLPGTPHECGPLLELGWLSRQLDLGHPVDEGVEAIRVDRIVGSVQRSHDFDACWHALNPRLARRIDEIAAATPSGLDDPIDVIRVDRAFFVRDGHKRVALARRTAREFIDAQISRVPSRYEVTPEVDEEAVLRTARESEFRRHSGMVEALPEVRFALTDIDDYGELFTSVQLHALQMAERTGGIAPRAEIARDWYASVYLPTVAAARQGIGSLIDSMTDADVFLAIHRQRVAWWGSECDAPDCAAQELLTERQIAAARRGSRLSALIRRERQDRRAALLPLSETIDHHHAEAPPEA